MSDKTRASYEIIFQLLQNLLIENHGNYGNLHTIIMDFEAAAHNAARAIFPNVTTKGCLFHFGQCLIRHVQRYGLMQFYENEESEIRIWIKKLKALALLPPDLIIAIWQRELRFPPNNDDHAFQVQLTNFRDYFEVYVNVAKFEFSNSK